MGHIQRKRQAKEREIYETAARLFAERGYYATRMEDIAAALDMQKGSLYYYFASKEELLAKLVEGNIGIALDVLQTIITENTPPSLKFSRAITAHLRVFQEHADIYTIYNSEKLSAITPQTADLADQLGRGYEKLWISLLTEGIAAGEFRPDLDIPIVMKAIMGMCNSTLIWFKPGKRLTIEETAEIFTRLLLVGLQA